jgi:hypothetical protein
MKKLILVLIFLALLFHLFSIPGYTGEICPSCSMSMFFTGETKVDWGKVLKLYECPVGHSYWIPSGSSPGLDTIGPKCPICGMGVTSQEKQELNGGNYKKYIDAPPII